MVTLHDIGFVPSQRFWTPSPAYRANGDRRSVERERLEASVKRMSARFDEFEALLTKFKNPSKVVSNENGVANHVIAGLSKAGLLSNP